jgi:hypothetical protein
VARKETRCWVRATDFSCPHRTTLQWAPRTVTSACTSQRHTPLQLGICFEPRICERAVPNGVFDSGVWSEGNNFNFHTSVPARLFAPEGCGAGGPPSLTMRGVSPATPPPLSAIKVKAASYVACFVLRSTLTAVRALAHTCELAHTHTVLKFLCGHIKSVTCVLTPSSTPSPRLSQGARSAASVPCTWIRRIWISTVNKFQDIGQWVSRWLANSVLVCSVPFRSLCE